DASAEPDQPAAHRRGHVVETNAAGVETDRAVDGVEGVRHRQVTDAAGGQRGVARELLLTKPPVNRRRELAASRPAAAAGKEALEKAEVRGGGNLEGDRLVLKPDRSGNPQPCVDPREPKLVDAYLTSSERQADWRGVVHGVVQQPQLQ